MEASGDSEISEPGTYYVKFDKYYDRGFHECYIDSFLRNRGPFNRIAVGCCDGKLMLGYKGKMLKEPYSYLVSRSCGKALANYAEGSPSPIGLDLWISSVAELTQTLKEMADMSSCEEDPWKLEISGVSEHTIAISGAGLCLFNFGKAMLTMEPEDCLEERVMPSQAHRLSGFPSEHQCVSSFFNAIISGIKRFTFRPTEAAAVVGFCKRLANAAHSHTWSYAASSVK